MVVVMAATIMAAATDTVERPRAGVIGGLAAGAILGAAVANNGYYYGPGPYAYGGGPYAYTPAPVYVQPRYWRLWRLWRLLRRRRCPVLAVLLI